MASLKKSKYYRLDKILELKPHFAVIIGTRSTGKTYACLEKVIIDYFAHGWQGAIIRRWSEDFRGKRGQQMFDALVENGVVSKASMGRYNSVYYYGGRWYFSLMVDGKREETSDEPFAYGFAISQGEHDKSTAYPKVCNIVFDEMVSRDSYIGDSEFVLFENVLSTIIRERKDNITVFMLGNTISKFCPYFNEMGLKHIGQMKEGDIDVYHYGTSELTVAVEIARSNAKEGKPSDVFFAFDSPQLSMITGNGSIWEMAVYPHLPEKILPKDIYFTYFIIFNGETLQCEIVQTEKNTFTYIHRKTGEIKFPDTDFVYTPDYSPRPNYRRKITQPILPMERAIAWYYKNEKVFYQDNSVGESVRTYLQWCRQ